MVEVAGGSSLAERLTRIEEKVTNLEGRLVSAHKRIDGVEGALRDDLAEIQKDMKELLAWMNQGKGKAALILMVAALCGGSIAALVAWLLPRSH